MKAKKALLFALASAVAVVGFSAAAHAQTRYFSFVTLNGPDSVVGADATTFGPHEFVIAVNNPVVVRQIERILANETWPGDAVHVKGKVVRGRVAYNEEYPFHLDSDSIELFAASNEECEATSLKVEEDLHLVGTPAFLASGIWCPWSSRLVREIRYPFPFPSK